MADRVRMKALSTFNNPLIESHAKEPRAAQNTVIEGDDFSTDEDHAAELERNQLAERTKGDAAPESERAANVRGYQTPTVGKNAVQTEKVIVGGTQADKA